MIFKEEQCIKDDIRFKASTPIEFKGDQLKIGTLSSIKHMEVK